jgi:hypothetical protein
VSERVSVLDVADSDELWELHARALRRAGMFLNDEDARQAMRTLWVDGRFRAQPGDASSLDLSQLSPAEWCTGSPVAVSSSTSI